jgi:hypothetical protein
MPLNHYLDDDYRYIIYRYHRILPTNYKIVIPKIQWGNIFNQFFHRWKEAVQSILNLIT